MLPLLRVENLKVDFVSEHHVVTAVNNISFEVKRGEVLALVGESGSGKSVTSLSVLRLLNETQARYPSGKILLSTDSESSIDILKLNAAQLQRIRGNTVSMIFQEPMTSLNPVMKCGKQITEALTTHKKISDKEAKKAALYWLEQVRLPQPAEIFHRYPHQLSGGQKQRIMIAMAMCCEPSLLICDEPTTALDVSVQRSILDLILDLKSKHDIGVIFITHDLGVVKSIADRIAIMYKGEIVQQELKPSMLEESPNASGGKDPLHPYTRALIACRPELYPRGTPLPVVSDFLTGNRLPKTPDPFPANPTATNREVLLSTRNLTVAYPQKFNWLGKPVKEFVAVNNVNLEIFRGETLGLVGESGCGKTTLGRTILGLVKPTSGEVIFKGRSTSLLNGKAQQQFRSNVQLVFQDPYSALNPRLEIGAAIAEPMMGSRLAARKKSEDLLAQVSLPPSSYHRYPHEFSGGQRQRIVIARALGLNPELLVCDESVSALDVSVQAQVLNLLNDLKRQLNLTVLFISHDQNVVNYMCDRVVRMEKGKLF